MKTTLNLSRYFPSLPGRTVHRFIRYLHCDPLHKNALSYCLKYACKIARLTYAHPVVLFLTRIPRNTLRKEIWPVKTLLHSFHRDLATPPPPKFPHTLSSLSRKSCGTFGGLRVNINVFWDVVGVVGVVVALYRHRGVVHIYYAWGWHIYTCKATTTIYFTMPITMRYGNAWLSIACVACSDQSIKLSFSLSFSVLHTTWQFGRQNGGACVCSLELFVSFDFHLF